MGAAHSNRWGVRRRRDTGPAAADDQDAPAQGAAMGRMARTLQYEHGDVEKMLQAITRAAVDGVPGAASAGITLISRRGELDNRAATDDLPKVLDALQLAVGQGPCLSALREQRTVRVDDLRTDLRWPLFTEQAVERGVGSMLAFQLFVAADNLGALNLYSSERAAFDVQSEEIGLVFASHAAIALVGAQQEAGLRVALDHRDLIGQAKGILMERYKLTGQQAFLLLVRASQHTNVKLRDVAERLALTGEFDEP